MTSKAIRDPLADHLITPQNATFILIDYQPSQFATVRSIDETLLRKNIVSTVKTVNAFGVPIVHSTVNVGSGQQQPTVPELAELLEDSPPLSSAASKLEHSRSAGYRSPASYSATGHASRPCRRSSRSF
jgi:nicotinamidase-related amidase